MTELSWPIESVGKPDHNGNHPVKLEGINHPLHFTTDELAAVGIPVGPYPTPPITITVTVGDRSEVVELGDDEVEWFAGFVNPVGATTSGVSGDFKVGAALRRLGVQP